MKTTTVNELAALSNLSTRRIRQLAEEGKLPKITRGEMPWPEAVNQLFKHYQKDSAELTRERLALATVNRQTKELELEQARGKFMERATAEREIIGVARRYHALVRQKVEVHSPRNRQERLQQLGLAVEIVQAFYAYDVAASQGVIDQIEAECEKIGRGEA